MNLSKIIVHLSRRKKKKIQENLDTPFILAGWKFVLGMWTAKPKISLCIHAVWSGPSLSANKTRKVFLEKKKQQMSPNPARVVILVTDMSSCPVLRFYQVSSKYCEEYSSCRAFKHKKGR